MIEQGTPEWHAMRCGKATASRMADIMAKTKTGVSASRANYMAEIVAERLTGKVAEGFISKDMEWGKEVEAEARAAYSFYRMQDVDEVAFVDHPTIAMSGASPDGLVGDLGLVEIKCPKTATHIAHLMGKGIPSKYVHQMQWQMACTGREWCDFVSFDPRLSEEHKLMVRRLERDDELIGEMEREVKKFLSEVDEVIAALGKLK